MLLLKMLFTTSPITTVVTTPPSAYQPELSRCDGTELGMTRRRLSVGAGVVMGMVGAMMGIGVGAGVGVGGGGGGGAT